MQTDRQTDRERERGENIEGEVIIRQTDRQREKGERI